MPVFDEIAIGNRPSPAVSIRRGGPLETGHYDQSGTWVLEFASLESVGVNGFGLHDGQPYFDTAGPAAGEQAYLLLQSSAAVAWVGT